ncbi:hypothetical protein TNCT_512061 [Trichonephila clavata]|uniref:Uncharacterized protein n=1 Tax=Trichonephila clavata TaxID=2740835 RepID=A0A8X6FQ93_TRICU|nr:hypothetical protein TNCT_512061 [Trichonephila clavata]
MEENTHSSGEMCPEDSNVPGVAQEVCLQKQNMGSSDSETQNGLLEEEDMHGRYSRMTRYLLLMSLEECTSYSRLPFFHELEDIEFYGISAVTNYIRLCLFREEFSKILEKRNEKNTYCEVKHVEFLLSRCVLLCPLPTYPRFVLVVAFLINVIILDVDNIECFRITYLAEYCLNVLYGRMFSKIFRSREDYQCLKNFCHRFYRQLELCSTMSELRKTPVFVTWRKLIQGCIEDSDGFFPFKQSEINLYFKAVRERNCMECEPEMARTLESTYFSGPEFRKMQSLCQICGAQCHNYLTYVSSFISKN